MDLTLLAAFAVACFVLSFVLSVVPGPDILNIVANAGSAAASTRPWASWRAPCRTKILPRRSFKRWLERESAAIFGALAVRLVLDARNQEGSPCD